MSSFILHTYKCVACGACGGGERCVQGVGGEACGKEAIGETQT
jgi:hypothetical protein